MPISLITIVYLFQLSKLQERLKDILSLVEDIELSMEGTRTHKDKTQQEIDKVVEDIFGRLNDQLRKKLQRLTGVLGGVAFRITIKY